MSALGYTAVLERVVLESVSGSGGMTGPGRIGAHLPPGAPDAGAFTEGPHGEHALVLRGQAGDRQAFGQLYQNHIEAVYAYIALRVRDAALAEDLTQDVFVSAWRSLAGFRWQGSLAPWLMRIAHNRIANHWRTQGRRPEQVSLPGGDDPDDPRPEFADSATPSDDADLGLGSADLSRAMERLTDLQRQVIALRFGAGLSLAETADMLQRTQNAVKNLQHNALANLRRHLPSERAL